MEHATPKAVEEIVRVASPVTFMRRTATEPVVDLSDHDFEEGDKVVLFYGAANRDPRCSPTRNASTSAGIPIRTSASAVRDRTSASAPTWPAGSCRSCSASCSAPARHRGGRRPRRSSRPSGIPLVGGIKHLPVRFTPRPPASRP